MGVNQLNRQNFDGGDVQRVLAYRLYCVRVSVTNVAEKPKYYTANSNPEQWDLSPPQIDQRLQW